MTLTLIIDTSTERAVVAFVEGIQVLFTQFLPFGSQSSRSLIASVEQGFQFLKARPSDLSRIGVGTGPGLFTGIRVGVAFARGLSIAQNIPLIGFNALQGFTLPEEGPFWSVIDLRLGGVAYLRQIREAGGIRILSSPKACPLEDFLKEQANMPVVSPSLARLKIPYSRELPPDIARIAWLVNEGQEQENLSLTYFRAAI